MAEVLPKYLENLGAPIPAIGLFGTFEDFLDGVYQCRAVARRSPGAAGRIVLFIAIASAGYLTYWLAPTWPWIFLGLLFAMAWTSMASPTLFSIIGDALPSRQRAMGFTVQSVLKRIPIVAAPTVGGMLIAVYGLRAGVRVSLLAAIALAAVDRALLRFHFDRQDPRYGPHPLGGIWQSLPSELRHLLLSDDLHPDGP